MKTTRDAARALAAAGMLAAGTAGRGLAAEPAPTLPAGFRAFTVPLQSYQLQPVKPGVRIDMMVSFEAKTKEGKEWVTATILQNVLVLDVQTSPSQQDGLIVLALNPNEMQYAALAIDAGHKVRIGARPPGDELMKPMEMASFRKLFR